MGDAYSDAAKDLLQRQEVFSHKLCNGKIGPNGRGKWRLWCYWCNLDIDLGVKDYFIRPKEDYQDPRDRALNKATHHANNVYERLKIRLEKSGYRIEKNNE